MWLYRQDRAQVARDGRRTAMPGWGHGPMHHDPLNTDGDDPKP